MTNGIDGTINSLNFGSVKKLFSLEFFWPTSSEEIIGNDELQENVIYIGLENIKSNGTSDWFRQERTLLVACSLALQTRKFQSLDNFFFW